RTRSLFVAPDGTLFVVGTSASYFVVRVSSRLSHTAADTAVVASSDGSEVYGFDGAGRHLWTRDGLTGITLRTFEYDPGGLLTGIIDSSNNRTTITRSSTSVDIAGPFGQTTTLQLSADGYATKVT